uniref:Pentatricopeptide repeat-containing protein n=1 Tax=Steinernema glaseri TaxID=37863 RepID=A0A1I7ZBQ9_9BILA
MFNMKFQMTLIGIALTSDPNTALLIANVIAAHKELSPTLSHPSFSSLFWALRSNSSRDGPKTFLEDVFTSCRSSSKRWPKTSFLELLGSSAAGITQRSDLYTILYQLVSYEKNHPRTKNIFRVPATIPVRTVSIFCGTT